MLKRLDCRAQRDSQVTNVQEREVTEALLFYKQECRYDDLDTTARFIASYSQLSYSAGKPRDYPVKINVS